jgi:endonuclease YncB( thermonuclease family)
VKRLWAITVVVLLIGGGVAESRDAAPASVTGRASVVDGDTIEIQGARIRLHGIDAPESGQTCTDAASRPWRCGREAAFVVADMLGSRPGQVR